MVDRDSEKRACTDIQRSSRPSDVGELVVATQTVRSLQISNDRWAACIHCVSVCIVILQRHLYLSLIIYSKPFKG